MKNHLYTQSAPSKGVERSTLNSIPKAGNKDGYENKRRDNSAAIQ